MKQSVRSKLFLIVPLIIFIYIATMTIISYPRYSQSGKMDEFYFVIVTSLMVCVLLFFVLRKRQKLRERRRK